MRIDTHQHFWTYSAANYPWIDPATVVARNFSPVDLRPELSDSGIQGTVIVEARAQIQETRDLLQIANESEFVRGIVGWLPLVDPKLEGLLDEFAGQPKLRGLRHAIAAEPDPEFAARPDFNRGLALLARRGLRYDLSLVPTCLKSSIALVDRHPEQIFILDHLAKPYIRAGEIEPWRQDFKELARRPNVYCKISGMVTEADWQHWTPAQLRPYLDTALEAFTPQRLMFGSDWPMCLLATSYASWVGTVEAWAHALTETERERLWSGTAVEAYGLTPHAWTTPLSQQPRHRSLCRHARERSCYARRTEQAHHPRRGRACGCRD
jgi:L-fuconolactonase